MFRVCLLAAALAAGCNDTEDPRDAGERADARATDAAIAASTDAGPDARVEPADGGPDATAIDAFVPTDAFFIADAAACEPWSSRVPPLGESWCDGTRAMDPPGEDRWVALTFDDGPRPDTTAPILAALRDADVPATFFVQGGQIWNDERRALVREEHEDPLFTVGNHSFSHSNFTEITLEAIDAEIDDTNALIRDAIGDPCYFPRYFRFPYGAATCRETEVVEAHGFGIAGIQIDPADWCYGPEDGHCPEEVAPWMPEEFRDDLVGFVLDRLEASGGGILLLHDIQPNTARLLPEILRRIDEAGFTFVRLADLPILNAAVRPPEPPLCCAGMVH